METQCEKCKKFYRRAPERICPDCELKSWVFDFWNDEVSQCSMSQIKNLIEGGNLILVVDSREMALKWKDVINKERLKERLENPFHGKLVIKSRVDDR